MHFIPRPLQMLPPTFRFGLFLARIGGYVPLNPVRGEIVPGDTVAQTRQVMNNLNQVIVAAGFAFRNIVKTTICLNNLAAFFQVKEVYASFFDGDFLAWTTVQVIPLGAMVEIEAYAVRQEPPGTPPSLNLFCFALTY